MLDILWQLMTSFWAVLEEASIFLLLGFFLAGLLKALVPQDMITNHLGGKGSGSVFKAALAGIPLPLCSCGVLPAAAGLRKQGAGKGATTAFMISTPETGVDSIAITYALLDPLMTLLRPLAAFITALSAGLWVNKVERNEIPENIPQPEATSCCHDGCCSGGEHAELHITLAKPTLKQRLVQGMRFAFGDLFQDIALWFLAGTLAAAAITVFIPANFISTYLGQGILPILAALLLSLPLYVCATSSTPLVAALALKGLSPGAALVFLLAGPATNIATLGVVFKILGRRAGAIYVSAIAGCAVLLGILTDFLYVLFGLQTTDWIASAGVESHGPIQAAAAVLLLLLTAWALHHKFRRNPTNSHSHTQTGCSCGCGH